MKSPAPFPRRVTWSVFILVLLFAALFVAGAASQLPPTVASHFVAFLTATAAWLAALMLAIRRPAGE